MRLQLRITLLTVLGLSLALAAFGFLGLRAVDETSRQIRQERLIMASTIARQMERALEHSRHMVQVTTAREGVHLGDQDLEPEAHALHDAHLLSGLPLYRLLLLDPQGVVRLAEPEDEELLGTDLNSLAVVERGLKSSESVISGFVSQQVIGRPAVLFTVPLTDGWMVLVAVDLLDEDLAGLLGFAAPGHTGYVQIVDGEGTVLVSTRPEDLLQPWEHVATLPALQAERAGTVGFYPAVRAGQPVGHELVAFAPLSAAPWGVAVEQAEGEALAPVRRLQRDFALLGVAVLAGALLLVWVTTRQVVRRVQVLTAVARRLTAGELDGSVPLMGEDEIGELARTFESMRASLSASRRETEFLLEQLHRAGEEADRLADRLAAQYEETRLQAITDPLTGLYNRRQFEERLAEEIGRARRYGHPLSMLMADIDHFKHYNDTHGHPQGDVVLQDLAHLLRASVRETDFVARYGGEEFTVLLPETTKAGALATAEKIRAVVADHPFPSTESQPGGKLTISLGVATFPEAPSAGSGQALAEPADTFAWLSTGLVRKADQALYRAKAAGRDRVCGAWE